MVKIALVGAGYIAQAHASAIKQIKDAKIVAVTDKIEELGKKLAQSCNAEYFADIDEILKIK